jgi:predicted ribosome quality control (RQC) complex YloA/Tae2 family protein
MVYHHKMHKITKYIAAIKEYIEFRVGQNAKENFDLIDDSEADDIWFHISQVSSCHVVASIPSDKRYDKNILKKIAVQGAVICKQYSKYKSERVVHVIYTKIHNVTKSATIGTVLLEEYKTIIL